MRATRQALLVRCGLVGLVALSGCESSSKPRPTPAAPSASVHVVAQPAVQHGDDDDEAHPARPAPVVATATALSADARSRLSNLRVTAHTGAVNVRKTDAGWTIAGPAGCTVAPARIERALDNLAGLSAVPSDERVADFELQLVVLIDQERALHFDIAARKDGTDLVQLADFSAYRVSGLDRELWAPDPAAWCAPER